MHEGDLRAARSTTRRSPSCEPSRASGRSAVSRRPRASVVSLIARPSVGCAVLRRTRVSPRPVSRGRGARPPRRGASCVRRRASCRVGRSPPVAATTRWRRLKIRTSARGRGPWPSRSSRRAGPTAVPRLPSTRPSSSRRPRRRETPLATSRRWIDEHGRVARPDGSVQVRVSRAQTRLMPARKCPRRDVRKSTATARAAALRRQGEFVASGKTSRSKVATSSGSRRLASHPRARPRSRARGCPGVPIQTAPAKSVPPHVRHGPGQVMPPGLHERRLPARSTRARRGSRSARRTK